MKFRKKKVKKQRGSKTHGYGAMKKHRGAGSRGGRGMAGSGKRGDAKKPSIQKNKKYFGKFGFKSLKKRKSEKLKTINIEKIEQQLTRFLEKKHAEKKGNLIFIDLKKMGYDKLLGKGKGTNKLEINVNFASKKAIEKIQSKGGKVNVLVVKEKPKKEKKPDAEEIKEEKGEKKEPIDELEGKEVKEVKEDKEDIKKEKTEEVAEKETKE